MGQKHSSGKKEQEIKKTFELYEIEFLKKKYNDLSSNNEGFINSFQ